MKITHKKTSFQRQNKTGNLEASKNNWSPGKQKSSFAKEGGVYANLIHLKGGVFVYVYFIVPKQWTIFSLSELLEIIILLFKKNKF